MKRKDTQTKLDNFARKDTQTKLDNFARKDTQTKLDTFKQNNTQTKELGNNILKRKMVDQIDSDVSIE